MFRLRAALVVVLGVGVLLGWAGPGAAENWPQFRGPTGLGYTTEKDLPVRWGGEDKRNVLWQAPLKGNGHASPIVWGDRVFVCTVLWPPTVKDRTKVIPEHHVLCYRTSDGTLLWDRLLRPGPWVRTDFRSGPGGGYACPTPTTDGKLVFCAFGSSVIAALDFQGKIVWRKEILPHTFDVTLGSSPVLYGETVILLCAMAARKDSCVVAYAKGTGAVKWRRPLPTMRFGHSTPVIIQVEGKPQMVVVASGMGKSSEAIRSLDPAGGEILWWCKGAGDASSPAYGAGVLYADSGRGGSGVAVDPTGRGDVSRTHLKWTGPRIPEAIGSPIIVGEYLYRLHSPGYLKCWKVSSGEQVYSQKLSGISTTWASPVVDPNGRIYFANAGKSYVVQAGRECKVLAVNDLGDGSHPSPAVSGGRIFLVGRRSVHCIGKK